MYKALSFTFLSIFMSQAGAQNLSAFVLACSSGGGQPWYRLVSDGKDVYFASIVNQGNINAASKSIRTIVEPREIIMNFQRSDGSKEEGILSRDTLRFQFGRYSSFTCEKTSDNAIFQTLKSAYENNLQKTLEKQRAYDNRPNKL